MGVPVNTQSRPLNIGTVSGNDVQIFVANFDAIRFASPGVKSDSWIITGTLAKKPAIHTGTDTKPPFENITAGLILLIKNKDCAMPNITFKGSVMFFKSAYLLSLPDFIA